VRAVLASLLSLLLLGCSNVTVQGSEVCATGGDGPGPLNTLTYVQGWVHVVGVVEATRQPEGGILTLPAVVTDANGSNVTVRIHASFWPEIDAALAHDSQVWLAVINDGNLPPNFVAYVVAVQPDGSVSFPGRCTDWLVQWLEARYGDAYSQVMRDALGKSGADLQAVFDRSASSDPPPGGST